MEAPLTAPKVLDVQNQVDGQMQISTNITLELRQAVSRLTVVIDIAGAAATASSSDVGPQPVPWQHWRQFGQQGVSEAWLRKKQARAMSHAQAGWPPPNDAARTAQQTRCSERRRNHPGTYCPNLAYGTCCGTLHRHSLGKACQQHG